MNPQLVITVPDETDVILSVAQNNALEPQVIGFTGYDLSEEVAAADSHLDTSKQFFKTKRSLVNSQYTNSRQVTLRTKLNEGFYLILPTTYEPNQVRTFNSAQRDASELMKVRNIAVPKFQYLTLRFRSPCSYFECCLGNRCG